MKDRKYDKRHVRSKSHSGCLETSCHVRGPLRNKMATLGVIPSHMDSDPSMGCFHPSDKFMVVVDRAPFLLATWHGALSKVN